MATKTQLALAKNMKRHRTRLGLSQARLAEMIGVSIPFIGEIEISRKSPSLETLEKIATALEIEPFELLFDGKTFSKFAGGAMNAALADEIAEFVRTKTLEYIEVVMTKKVDKADH
ncbi:MAG: helix-turn-helix transcriptional regulator [Treponema sp.]|nr:helix-turn-helix transcriptional regulator [Treponema sp.]